MATRRTSRSRITQETALGQAPTALPERWARNSRGTLDVDPGDMTTTARLELARRFLGERRHSAALRLIEPLTTRAPRTRDDIDAYRVMALAAYGLRRYAEAESAAGRVLSRRPKDVEMMRILVRALQGQGRHADAAAWMSTLDALGSDTWDDPAA